MVLVKLEVKETKKVTKRHDRKFAKHKRKL